MSKCLSEASKNLEQFPRDENCKKGMQMAKHYKDDSIILGTTLALSNIGKQKIAVNSWIKNGFRVVACNTREEIEKLKTFFIALPIEFVEIERMAEQKDGKKLPYIQDILEIVSCRAERVCGYINSDIILSDMSKEMLDFIATEVKNSMVFVRRNEIGQYSDISNLNWRLHFDGIDMFFMDKYLIPDFYNDGFFAQSLWDLCILIKCKILGIKIKELLNPIAFHVRHPVKWNFDTSNLLVEKFMAKYYEHNRPTYKHAIELYYNILYEDCEQICFCATQKYRCLFILENNENEVIESIRQQDYCNKDIRFTDHDTDHDQLDIVFYMKERLVITNMFCKMIIYIMETFHVDSIQLGRFFVSEDKGKKYYNELNRNIGLIEKINVECNLHTLATKNNSTQNCKIAYFPISYERIDLNDSRIIDLIKLPARAYVIPAGVRAGEWVYMNNLNIEIVGYIDNNIQKSGNEIMGKQIYSIRVLEKDKNTQVIIASKYFSLEIEKQLLDILEQHRILKASNMLKIDTDGTIYYFNLEKYKAYVCRKL